VAVIVADTDVLIDALHGREPVADHVRRALQSARLATTTITVFELMSGARSESARAKIERLLAAITVLRFDETAARSASEVRRALEGKGTPIGMADYLIAGVCLSRSAVLLTRNRAHFERVPGLQLAPAVS
jgi:tRNA(fMet)-specific endonuclease VapC